MSPRRSARASLTWIDLTLAVRSLRSSTADAISASSWTADDVSVPPAAPAGAQREKP
jgi:hypothetical protein